MLENTGAAARDYHTWCAQGRIKGGSCPGPSTPRGPPV